MSLLVAIKAGDVLDVALRGVSVVDSGTGSGGEGFGGRGGSGSGGRGWEGTGRARCIGPSSISDEEGLVSDYAFHKESVASVVDCRVTSYLAAERLVHVLADVFHDGYIAKVAFGQEEGHSFSVLGESLLTQLFVFGYLLLCLDGGVNHHVSLPQSL